MAKEWVYPNLRAEMAREGRTIKSVAELLKCKEETAAAKLQKEGRLTVKEMWKIRNEYFGTADLNYLFQMQDKPLI